MMAQATENGDQRIPRTPAELLAETHKELQDWHDARHGLTFMDICPHEPCSLLSTEFTRWRQ